MVQCPFTEQSIDKIVRILRDIVRIGKKARLLVHYDGKRFVATERTEVELFNQKKEESDGSVPY